ncbi:hypothetical protein ACFONN_10340 [Dyella humi]|uniref:Competence protein n=1 Tax=Dyella humi TaxID=1770547 RepID=A0ABW8IKT1_9GAMM
MYEAIVHGDQAKRLIHIKDWLITKRQQTAGCPVCEQVLLVKAPNSPTVNTHFSHEKNSGCPLTAEAGKAFERFTKTERVSAAEAARVKQYALENIESIYYRAKDVCPELMWTEFLSLLEKASQHNIWAFKDFNTGYLPYVLLCCAELFLGKRGSNRPHSVFFVLEPEASKSEFWHLPAGVKQRVWRVDVSTGICDVILMKLDEADPWYRTKAKAILKI